MEVDIELESLIMTIIADQVNIKQKFILNIDVMECLKLTLYNLLINQGNSKPSTSETNCMYNDVIHLISLGEYQNQISMKKTLAIK